MDDTPRLAYRVPEVCKMLGISRATFYRRVADGGLAIRKLGGVTLVTRESLADWVSACRGSEESATPDPHPGLAGDAEI